MTAWTSALPADHLVAELADLLRESPGSAYRACLHLHSQRHLDWSELLQQLRRARPSLADQAGGDHCDAVGRGHHLDLHLGEQVEVGAGCPWDAAEERVGLVRRVLGGAAVGKVFSEVGLLVPAANELSDAVDTAGDGAAHLLEAAVSVLVDVLDHEQVNESPVLDRLVVMRWRAWQATGQNVLLKAAVEDSRRAIQLHQSPDELRGCPEFRGTSVAAR